MTSALYTKGVKKFALNTLKWTAAGGSPFKAVMIDLAQYTPNLTTHEFLSDIPAGARVGTPVALTLIDAADDGVLDANDVTGYVLPGNQAALGAIVIFSDTGTAATSPLLCIIDNIFQVDVAAVAALNATTLVIEDLPVGIASGATLTKVSGSGPTTIVTTALGAAGARSLTVAAVTGAVGAGDVYRYASTGSTLPIAAGATSVNIVWDNGTYKIIQF